MGADAREKGCRASLGLDGLWGAQGAHPAVGLWLWERREMLSLRCFKAAEKILGKESLTLA